MNVQSLATSAQFGTGVANCPVKSLFFPFVRPRCIVPEVTTALNNGGLEMHKGRKLLSKCQIAPPRCFNVLSTTSWLFQPFIIFGLYHSLISRRNILSSITFIVDLCSETHSLSSDLYFSVRCLSLCPCCSDGSLRETLLTALLVYLNLVALIFASWSVHASKLSGVSGEHIHFRLHYPFVVLIGSCH